jgi:hypothetical protein
MSSRPLPGASYHTLETILHSFANVDLEAVGSLDTLESPSEKKSLLSNESTPLLKSRVRNRHGLSMLLGLIVFFCFAFTASAFLGYSASRWLMPDVPDRHVSVADHLSSAFQEQSYRNLVNGLYNDALVTLCVRVSHFFFPIIACHRVLISPDNFTRDQKLNCLRDEECQEPNVRESFLRTFPLLCVRGRTFTHGLATRTKRPSSFQGPFS